MNIGCAILAGGKSSRMGTDKALLLSTVLVRTCPDRT